ncbi:MAG: ribonuclease HII [Parcubacteria group bacterium]|nr:ribonuclease HII [Parcubacteria group bacterium]
MRKYTHLIGIDESGRGPLAGPVVLAAICVERRHLHRLMRRTAGLKDPKRMTEKQRGEWFDALHEAEEDGLLRSAVASAGNSVIDARGIVRAIRSALQRAVRKLGVPRAKTLVLLDGGLTAQRTFTDQATIIRGDSIEPLIMLAALAAKVTRDRIMVRQSARYPRYDFHKHKGYGTRAHYAVLDRIGPSAIHRRCYLVKWASGRPPSCPHL